MAIGTPFHERTATLNQNLAWRTWSGYHAATCYGAFHEPEYAAIRNSAALIDVSPLYNYLLEGPDAGVLADRVFTRDIARARPNQVLYTPWCDAAGHVIQEGTVLRRDDDTFQVNATEPTLRWLQHNAAGLDVRIEDCSRDLAALAVQGPRSRDLLDAVSSTDVAALRFFRATDGTIAGVPVTITRTGYTGDLGYEVWIPAGRAVPVWDAITEEGRRHGARACGLLALDIARIEAGFLLMGVDYVRADRARIPSQRSTPDELGLGWSVALDKAVPCVGHEALVRERAQGAAPASWRLVGLEVAWEPLEAVYADAGLMPDLPTEAWRTGLPVYRGREQVGRATSGCWSRLLKRYIALASIPVRHLEASLALEVTVDYARTTVPATVVDLPFFRPERMRATPTPIRGPRRIV